jgi:hypothetical protein
MATQARISLLDLDVAGVLAMCATAVPVNARVDVAIEAHRIAFARFVVVGEEEKALAMYTLRAIILARTPTAQDYRDQLDYLSGLPETAWEEQPGYTAPQVRHDTLSAIKRNLRHIESP